MRKPDTPLIDRPSFALFVVLLTAVVLILLDYGNGEGWFRLQYWLDGDAKSNRSAVVRNLGLLAAGVIGLGFGIWRAVTAYQQTKASQRLAEAANEQASIAAQGQITDRFAKAVELLGSENPTVRIGAVYALGRIARDSIERDHIAVMQTLANFIRHSPYAEEREREEERYRGELALFEIGQADETHGADDEPDKPSVRDCPDVLAAMEVIAERTEAQSAWERTNRYALSLERVRLPWLNLTGANLTGMNLPGANFSGAILTKNDLTWVNLIEANLFGANLTGADLSGANLKGVNLIGADLSDANLSGVKLHRAKLTGANLTGANLTAAYLGGADLSRANLFQADLTRANLFRASLSGADLSWAGLSGAKLTADLSGAGLSGADLSGADLSETNNLSRDQVAEACVSDPARPPRLPAGDEFKDLVLKVREKP